MKARTKLTVAELDEMRAARAARAELMPAELADPFGEMSEAEAEAAVLASVASSPQRSKKKVTKVPQKEIDQHLAELAEGEESDVR